MIEKLMAWFWHVCATISSPTLLLAKLEKSVLGCGVTLVTLNIYQREPEQIFWQIGWWWTMMTRIKGRKCKPQREIFQCLHIHVCSRMVYFWFSSFGLSMPSTPPFYLFMRTTRNRENRMTNCICDNIMRKAPKCYRQSSLILHIQYDLGGFLLALILKIQTRLVNP